MRKKNEVEQPQALGEEHPAQESQEKEVQGQPQQEQAEESQQSEQEEPKQETEPKQEKSQTKAAKTAEAKEEPTSQKQDAPDESRQRIQALEQEVLELRSRNAAYAAGVRPDMVEDAVTLSMAQAQAAGEVTEETVQQAMEQVLQRHPEWKVAPAGKKASGGFVLGSDPSRTTDSKPANGRKTENKKPWNKFNR